MVSALTLNIRRRVPLFFLALSGTLLSCQGDNADQLREISQYVYSVDQSRILGLEAPTSDWSVQLQSYPLSESTDVTQGFKSARVTSTGSEFSLRSAPLGQLVGVGGYLEIDIKPPSVSSGWSYVRPVLRRTNYPGDYQQVGIAQLDPSTIVAGEFNTLRFPLNSVQSILSTSYQDIVLELFVNGPSGTYQFDRISFGGDADFGGDLGTGGSSGTGGADGSGGASDGAGGSAGTGDSGGSGGIDGGSGGVGGTAEIQPVEYLEIRTPKGVDIHQMVFAAQGSHLAINDRVRLFKYETEARADVSAVGTPGTNIRANIGVDAQVGNVYSQLDVELRSRGAVYGNLVTSGSLIPQYPYTVTGTTVQGVDLNPHEVTQLGYRFPSSMVPLGYVEGTADISLTSGGYGSTVVQGGGTLRLSTGTYYFDDLLVNAGSTLVLDSVNGPIFVVIRGEFHKHGTFQYTTGYRNVAFIPVADDFVPIVGEFAGTLIAPNSSIDLSTTTPSNVIQRIGAMIGQSITAHQGTPYHIRTFDRDDCDTACGIMWGCAGKEPYIPCEGEPPVCAPDCEPGVECEDDGWCKGDCGDQNGVHFGQLGANVCWGDDELPVICTDREDFFDNCGEQDSLCGLCLDGPCVGNDCLRPCQDPTEPGCEHCYDGVLNVDEWQLDCGPSCPNQNCSVPSVPCDNDAMCGAGAICSDLAPLALGLDDLSQSVCWNDECASGMSNCGTPDNLCGLCICQPSCEDRVCGASAFDGCNGQCSGTCDAGEPGCMADADCPLDHRCLSNAGVLFGYEPSAKVCIEEDCLDPTVAAAECGFEGARCGEVCPAEYTPCLDMECGRDPRTGEACGTCGTDMFCNLQNTCSVPVLGGSTLSAFSMAYEVGATPGEYATTPTGKASYRIPLRLPPGAGGVEPELEFVFHDTSNFRGMLGPGWSLTGISKVHRCATPGAQDLIWNVRHQENLPSTFCLDGQPLIFSEELTDEEGDSNLVIYQVADEASRKIVYDRSESAFTMFTPDGRIHSYGTTDDSKRKVFQGYGDEANIVAATWYITETRDRFGNLVEYHYEQDTSLNLVRAGELIFDVGAGDNRAVYPDYILYSRHGSSDFGRKVNFHYIKKDDPLGRTVGYEHHAQSVDNRLLESITVDTYDGQSKRENVRSYYVDYGITPGNNFDGLKRVEEIGECASANGSTKCLPPTRFTYDDPSLGSETYWASRFGEARPALEQGLERLLDGEFNNAGFHEFSRALPLDADGDGVKDLFSFNARDGRDTEYLFLRGRVSTEGEFSFDTPVTVTTSVALDFRCLSPAAIVDLDGDGREEIVDGCPLERGQRNLAFFRLSADGELTEHLTNKPALGRVHVGDIDGNGRPDFVQDLDDFVYFSDFGAYDEGVMQVNFSRVSAYGEPSASAPLFVDVDGDGVANLLRFSKEDEQFYALGFLTDTEANEVTSGHLTASDGTQHAFLSYAVSWNPTFLTYEWDPLPDGGSGNRDTLRVLDINGDGLQDVWIQPNLFVAPLDPNTGSVKFGGVTLLDNRGFVAVGNTFKAAFVGFGYHPRPAHIWLNQGGTFKRMKAILGSVDGADPKEEDCPKKTEDGACLLFSTPHSFRNSTVFDYDLDGRQDLVVTSSEVQARFHVVEQTTDTLHFAQITLPNSAAASDFSVRFGLGERNLLQELKSNSIWSDFDGDGNVDVVMNLLPRSDEAESHPQDIYDRLFIWRGENHGNGRRLQSVTDGLGNHIKIDRALAREVVDMSGNCGRDDTEFGNQPRCLTRLGPMVERVSRGTVDGEHFGSTSYAYSHPATADFLQGYFFTERTISEESDGVGSNSLPKVVATTHEEYTDALENTPWHSAQTYPFLHAPTKRETRLVDALDLNDEPRSRMLLEHRSYDFQGFPGAAYMYERQVRTIDETASGEETTKTVEEYFDVDSYGLPSGYSRTVYGGNSWPIVSEYEVTSIRNPDRVSWILDKFEWVTETVNGASESFHYEHDDSTGFVTQMTKQYGNARELITVYTPDSFGNIGTMTENGERVTQFDYGNPGIFLQVVQNAQGHSQTFGYDDALGLQTEHRNENGYGLLQEYDGFGRLVLRVLDNGGTKITESEIVYSKVSPTEVDGQNIQSRVRLTVSSDYYLGESIREFDSRDHLVRTQDPGLGVSGGTPDLVTEKTYDWAGRMTRSSQAHLASATPEWTRLSYDDRGRPTRVRSPQGDFWYRYAAHTQYENDLPEWVIDDGLELVHVTDSEGVERVLVKDEKERNVLTAEGVNLANHETGLISQVIYGAWDLPERFIDPELNETMNLYTGDRLLRWTEDANRGRTSFTYDVYGNVISELTADGVQSEFTYDLINRPRTRIDHLADGDQTTEWKYDLDVPGTLSEMIGPTGIKTEFQYEGDPRALQNLVRYTIGEESFTTEVEYDALGRTSRVMYPSVSLGGDHVNFAVRPTYDVHSGHQMGVQSDDQATDYWKVDGVDYASQRVTVGFGNGVVEERNYDPTSRRLTSINTQDHTGSELSALSYQYYNNGQMRDRSFTHGGDTHLRSFTYDRALRLEAVSDDGEDEHFEFSPAGRLLARSKYGGYTYDAAQPHAVTSVGDNEFDYDERGNQYLRMGPDIPGTTQTTRQFSRFNLPVQVDIGDPEAPDESLTHEYDAAGRRVVKRAEMASVEVLTPGDLYQRQSEAGEAYGLHTFRVFMEGREVLQVQYDSETEEFEYRYLHRDHLESVLYTTNEYGEPSEVRDFDVFGAALSDPEWARSIEESFTGHKADYDLGLLEAGVRMYDPKFGVFTTPDALRESGTGSQAFNPFAYANNDPVNWFDPTGFAGEQPGDGSPGWGHAIRDDQGGMLAIHVYGDRPDAGAYVGTLDYYGWGAFSNLYPLMPAFDQVEDTSPTWETIFINVNTVVIDVVTGGLTKGGRALGGVGRWFGKHLGLSKGAGARATKGAATFGPKSVGAAQRVWKTLQTGGHTLKSRTAKGLNEANGLNLHAREWGRALEDLKGFKGLGPNFHQSKILENGNVLHRETGEVIGNLLEFLP